MAGNLKTLKRAETARISRRSLARMERREERHESKKMLREVVDEWPQSSFSTQQQPCRD